MDLKAQIITEYLTQGVGFRQLALEVWNQPHNDLQMGSHSPGNGDIRKELLNAYVFTSLAEVRQKAEEWMIDYNSEKWKSLKSTMLQFGILEDKGKSISLC